MTEEIKETPKQGPETIKPADVKQPETPVAEAPAAQAAPVKEEKAEAAAPAVKKEKPANCEGCKKSIKKKRWYYRNGKYYCTKRCWGATDKKAQKTQEAPAS